MKRSLLSLIVILFTIQANAQVLYLETFDGISGPTAGGAGTYTFPPAMLLRNVDNLTPNPAVSYVNAAWSRREDFNFNVADSCAFSTSWYNPIGTANDFMWTPAVALPATGLINLSWNAVTYDALFPDGYEVRIMNVAPTGGTGVIGNQIINSTVLFSTAAENSTWTPHVIDISGYFGQTVYIGFRNNSTDKFLLLIDDIKIEKLNPFDASVTAIGMYEYTQTPLAQASIPLSGTVSNLGSSALTNVNLQANVYDNTNTLVYSAAGTAVPSLAAAATANFTLTPFIPSMAGTYTIKYYPTQTEVDLTPSNDTLTQTIVITENIFARDRGAVVGALGIGAGNGGYIGQSFTLTAPAYLYSISTAYNVGYTGENYASIIWNTDGAGTPTTILASTDTLQYPDNNPIFTTVPMSGGTVLLPAGTYVVTATEFDSTVQVSLTDEIFTLGKTWVNWPTTPFGGWANVEAFGVPSFNKGYVLRMNVGSTLFPLASEALSLKGKSGNNENQLTWINNEEPNANYVYTLENSTDAKSWHAIYTVTSEGRKEMKTYNYTDRNNVNAKNYYRIRVSDNDNKLKYSNMVTLLNNAQSTQVEIYPNPAKTHFTLNTNNFTNVTLTLTDAMGKEVYTQKLDQSVTSVSLKGIAAGVYQINLANANGMIYVNKLIVE
ncbi:MAG: choice-of-anchor J domain-containing protein [Bacteroidetes bacterium]|nr:choice-of-anchor J domain-containing protein [Bacteroidota bacterium]